MTSGRGMGTVRGGRRSGWASFLFALIGIVGSGLGPVGCVDSAREDASSTSSSTSSSTQAGAASGDPAQVGSPGDPTAAAGRDGWNESQLALMRSLSIDALPPVPKDPSNRVADDPDAAALGQRLFFDARLSSNGRVACATCHEPERFFTDGRAVSQGVGLTGRNAPTVVGSAYSPWLFWDGRRDSLWAQALAPLESSAEMNVSRTEVVRLVAADPTDASLYTKSFRQAPLEGDLAKLPPRAGPFGDSATKDAWARLAPADRQAIDRAFANVGKALAAYQRRLVPGPGRFDRYVRSLGAAGDPDRPPDSADRLSEIELEGLRLFLDSSRTQCLRCHNGPLLTNQAFHRIGTEFMAGGLPEFGRFLGLQAALLDPFNCLGPFSDARPDDCRELRFVRRDHVQAETGKFKTPTLRGLSQSAPYMHDGRMATLEAVIEHYRHPPPRAADPASAHELLALELSDDEARALVAFLKTLDAPVAAEPSWLAAPAQAAPAKEPAFAAP